MQRTREQSLTFGHLDEAPGVHDGDAIGEFVHDPKIMRDEQDRRSAFSLEVAKQCQAKLSRTLPTVVDDMQDSVNQRYRAWPERIYVIDRAGVITYKAGLGPFGFKPDEAEEALLKLL